MCVFKLALRVLPSWRISPWKFRASFNSLFISCVFSRAESCSTTSSRICLRCSTTQSSSVISSAPISALLAVAWHRGGTTVHVPTLSSLRKSSRCDCHWPLEIGVRYVRGPYHDGERYIISRTRMGSAGAETQGPRSMIITGIWGQKHCKKRHWKVTR